MQNLPIRAVLLGLAAYLLFLASTLPATLVVPAQLPGGVELSGVSGSVWHGQAAAAVWREQNLGRLEWWFAPLALLHARLGLRFTVHGSELQASGEFMRPWFARRPAFANLAIDADAALVGQFVTGVELKGRLLAHFAHAAWPAAGELQLTGSVQWTNALLAQPMDLRLGTVQADFQPGTARQTVKLELRGGDLSGQGTTTLDARAQYTLGMDLSAHSAEARQLLGALVYGAPRDRLRLSRSGALRALLRMTGG